MRTAPAVYVTVACTLAAGLCSCTVGPDYRPPAIATPQRFEGASANPTLLDASPRRASSPPGAGNPATAPASPPSSAADAQEDLSHWWARFRDPQLQRLIEQALSSNLDLKAAGARIRQAREQEVIAGAARLPTVNATGLGANIHSNSNPLASLQGKGGSSPGTGGSSGSPSGSGQSTDLKLYSAGFDASWELDVFGGTRRSVEAARAASEAAVWQLRDAEVSLSAEVAVDYLTLATSRSRLALLHDAIQRDEQILELTEARARAGFVSGLDVNEQRAQLANESAQVPELEAQARAMAHALAVLLGRPPEEMSGELAGVTRVPDIASELPPGLPSELLRRRPDIRQAERRLAGATAEIGVAVASLYPRFDLIAAASFAGDSLGNLLSSRNFARIGAGLIRWPAFQGGKTRANIRSTQEQREQAYLAYQQSVLGALRDTEDALVRVDAGQRRLRSLLEAQSAASSSLSIARSQYEHGVTAFLDVLHAEMTLLDTQDQVEQTRLAVAQAHVSLFKALGGGWQP